MAQVNVGDPAPNVVLKSVDSTTVPLAETWGGGRHALLIFLRHLA